MPTTIPPPVPEPLEPEIHAVAVVLSTETVQPERPSSSMTLSRESVSTVTDGLSFLINSAKIVTELGFSAAKFTTSTSINVARSIVDSVGENTGLDATGITPVISGSLYLADKISNAGIRVGEYFTNLSLKAAGSGVDSIGNVFGNTELALAIEEFSALVQRELERDLLAQENEDFGVSGMVGVDGPTSTETAVSLSTANGSVTKKSLKDIGFIEIAKSVTAWICLQRMTQTIYEERARLACSESLKGAFSDAVRHHHSDTELAGLSSGPAIDDITENDVVVDTDVSAASMDVVFAHIGTESNLPQSVDPLDPSRLFQNIRRYIRFCTGAYGKIAVEFFAPGSLSFNERREIARKSRSPESAHPTHAFYSTYTSRPLPEIYHTTFHNQKSAENPILSEVSSVPRILPENNTHYNPTFFLILDHPNKSVVLCLRGTLSLHDLFIDLTCESQRATFDGTEYLVHSGMYKAARRVALPAEEWLASVHEAELPNRRNSNDLPNLFRATPTPPYIYEAVSAGLQSNPGYALVVTGHSLGAGLASLITLQWGDAATGLVKPSSGFPPATRIHCFAYASPAIVSRVDAISRRTRYTPDFNNIVTSIIVGDDFVPDFSLGSVRDVTSVVSHMHQEPGLANRLVSRYINAKASGAPSVSEVESVRGLHAELYSKCFKNQKLFPVGRNFWVRKDAAAGAGGAWDVKEILRPDDVFGDMIFGAGMIADHVPNLYEDAIRAL
ncbi:hypothetical protein HDU81_000647 [Chytriomyces hyalinus]|nr:hypothetical protein HDU81_000647 [Chytriomyces hyalinus]